MEQVYRQLEQATAMLRARGFGRPRLALVLGSGLGSLADELAGAIAVEYRDIPGFAAPTVAGHAGRLVFGTLADVEVVAMQGRYHFYEGHSQRQIAYAVWLLRELGAETLVVTNAAGGLNPDFTVGDLMLIEDHINFTGDNPLRGPNPDRFGPRFPDMSRAYDRGLARLAREVAAQLAIPLRQGVYLAVSGPSYETPAEISSFRRLGADAVGMSTVPEVIAAVHCGLRVLGLSCITNLAAGLGGVALDHGEVIDTTRRVQGRFQALLSQFVAVYSSEEG